jgi:hypothetical protein
VSGGKNHFFISPFWKEIRKILNSDIEKQCSEGEMKEDNRDKIKV